MVHITEGGTLVKRRRIPCESPEEKIWNLYLLLENETTVRRFLEEKYQGRNRENPGRDAFRAAHSLIYHIKQARSLYQAARQSEWIIRPLLAYYGLMNLAKAWVLSEDPDYPRTASVLKHGLSTRKRKPASFSLFWEEVRVQREGLFPLLVTLAGEGERTGERWSMQTLFSMLPELQDSYRQLFRETSLFPIAWTEGEQGWMVVEEAVLDRLHLTSQGMVQTLERHRHPAGISFSAEESYIRSSKMYLKVEQPQSLSTHPWIREDVGGQYYLYINDSRRSWVPAEILVHYLLLFSLSMLCRYDTPLWGEMVYGLGSEEMVLIQEFLQLTQRKSPQLILEALFEERFLFSKP
ncbi:YaaC family protein [Desmospora activa]|uniref:YaaC-like protein n=1 Tax=Desmospora activa DSM 45169 TaxID=1121389 RepID=A0A2T4Z4Y3_9BACL|nr:YaaC family protein [Desmospora activa]PTM56916.1 YaaC-like protein [Desmospora activa DSM 45169]